jgi:chromosome segregation ATPase
MNVPIMLSLVTLVTWVPLASGCLTSPELLRARADLSRLEAEVASKRSTLEEAQKELKFRTEDITRLSSRIEELSSKFDTKESPEAASATLVTLEKLLAGAQEERGKLEVRVRDLSRAVESTLVTRDSEAERVGHLEEEEEARREIRVREGLGQGVKIGGGILSALLPVAQAAFPGLGFLGILAGAWEALRKRRER